MGRRRRQKNDSGIAGILLVDKPAGPTSFDIVADVRRALKTARVGHTGTLDPFASGLLVIVLGRYTKLASHFTNQHKSYEAEVYFGSETDTCDRTGEIVREGSIDTLNKETLECALEKFRGDLEQTPPIFSAIKVDGERLYKKARRGESVEIPSRSIKIHELTLKKLEGHKATLYVSCSKGTYIRALARDIGRELSIPAHLEELRRTTVGDFKIEDACALDDIQPEHVRRDIKAVADLKPIVIDEKTAERLRNGQKVPSKLVVDWADEVHAAFYEDDLVALVNRHGNCLQITRGLWPEVLPEARTDEE